MSDTIADDEKLSQLLEEHRAYDLGARYDIVNYIDAYVAEKVKQDRERLIEARSIIRNAYLVLRGIEQQTLRATSGNVTHTVTCIRGDAIDAAKKLETWLIEANQIVEG